MTIIEIPQGYYNDLTGVPKDEALDAFAQHDAEFLEKWPSARPYHRPSWREFEAPDDERAPWGYEWYVIDEAGLLKMHSAQYDSSG
jgi:hypothetical protein